MIESAIKYASLDFKVFPIREGMKAPATSNGFHAATSDIAQIKAWWAENPNYNVAIRTGKASGVFSLDVDRKNDKDGFEWLNAQGDFPDTVIQITPSGGKQFLFKMPEFFVGSNSGKIADGIDIRGEQGYILVPPSILKQTSNYKFAGQYEWMTDQGIGDIKIPSAPAWLLEKLLELIPMEHVAKESIDTGDIVIPISTVMDFYNIKLNEVRPGIFQGAHPIHGSTNGSNFKIDTNNNIWACYRHTKENGKPVGGGAIQLIAMMERIIDCEKCSKGALRGENFVNVIKILESKFGIRKELVRKETPNKMYEFAELIRDGDLGRDYIYCIEDNKYYMFDDNFWKDVHDLEISATLNSKMPEVNKYTLGVKLQIFGHLRVMLQKRLSCFNSSSYINFPEGEFDPTTSTLYPHDKEHYSTIRLPYSYNPQAECPIWIKTLNEILENDKSKIETLQEFFGYCLSQDMQLKKALLLLGESNTGKSTVLFVFKAMIGQINYATVPLKHLGHPQFTPMLINKLVNIDADVDKKAEEYEANFKKITSFEEIECNQKYIETFKFLPKCKIILAANIFPKITDHSSAFYNRLIIIPFDRIFEEHEMDTELVPKIIKELPGVFNWCVEGYNRLKKRGRFEKYEFSIAAVTELEDANNPSNIFIKEFVEIDMGGYVEKGELYERYKQWSDTNKQWTLSAAMFANCVYKTFHKNTPKNTSLNGKRIWRNIRYVNFKIPPQENLGYTE